MKKIFIMSVALLFVTLTTNAQTWAEWFQQKATQKKYLLQQIAALQVYIRYAKKGYDIANKGLNTIKDIKNGDFNLHNTFFSSLKNVNPKIRQYAKVADIIACQLKIVKKASHTIKSAKATGQLTLSEINYCSAVLNNLLDDCINVIDDLMLVTTSGTLEMKDDERLMRLDVLYADMLEKYSFCSSFCDEVGLLFVQRRFEKNEIDYAEKLNRIK